MARPFTVFYLLLERCILGPFPKTGICNIFLDRAGKFNEDHSSQVIRIDDNIWSFVSNTDVYWEGDWYLVKSTFIFQSEAVFNNEDAGSLGRGRRREGFALGGLSPSNAQMREERPIRCSGCRSLLERNSSNVAI